jgi:transposase
MYFPTYSPELNPIEQFWEWQGARLSAIDYCRNTLYQKELQKPIKVWRKVTSEALFCILISAGINVKTKGSCNRY